MDRKEWLVAGKMHHGAHLCLCVFTNNSRARSAAKHEEREQRNREIGRAQSQRQRDWRTFPKAKIAYKQPGGWIDDGTYKDQKQGEWIADGAQGLSQWQHSPWWK
jgi:hypothetical protein